MRFIIFNTFGSIHVASKCYMIPLPTILALGYAWIYICTSDCCNMASYIETSIDKAFSFGTTLSILNVNLYNGHIWFWWDFDDSGSRYKDDIIENISWL